MKLFSFLPPIEFDGNEVIPHNLALNHQYKKQGRHLIVNGSSSDGKWRYTAFYNRWGTFLYVHLYTSMYRIADTAIYRKFDHTITLTFDAKGNQLVKTNTYLTRIDIPKMLVKQEFTSTIRNETVSRKLCQLGGKWTHEGNFPQQHLHHWICLAK